MRARFLLQCYLLEQGGKKEKNTPTKNSKLWCGLVSCYPHCTFLFCYDPEPSSTSILKRIQLSRISCGKRGAEAEKRHTKHFASMSQSILQVWSSMYDAFHLFCQACWLLVTPSNFGKFLWSRLHLKRTPSLYPEKTSRRFSGTFWGSKEFQGVCFKGRRGQ